MLQLDDITQIDLNSFVVGDYIGSGTSRDVYHFPLIPNTVIKIEKSNKIHNCNSFQNTTEWLIAEELYNTKDKIYLALPLYISPSGRVMLQEYARDLDVSDIEILKNMKFPSFLTDIKISNLGKTADGRIVFRDYGTSILTNNYRLRSIRKDISRPHFKL